MRVRRLWPLLAAVTVIGLLFIGVFPTRTWLAQRDDLGRAEEQLEMLREENRLLAERVAALNTPAEVERLARERHNLVLPGEESYAILPAPEEPAPP